MSTLDRNNGIRSQLDSAESSLRKFLEDLKSEVAEIQYVIRDMNDVENIEDIAVFLSNIEYITREVEEVLDWIK